MYVWSRLAHTLATAKRRGTYAVGEESRLDFRCLPSDVDLNLHLNNARYGMLADLGRLDLFWRTGLLQEGRKRRWAPMLGGIQTAFVREIRLWQRFSVLSSIETWEGTVALGRHRFVLATGETAAVTLTAAGVYDRGAKRFLQAAEILAALGVEAAPREPSPEERDFLRSHAGLRALAKATAASG